MLSPDSPSNRADSAGRRLRYELLTLGDELLLGLTANGHLTFIGAQLGARGVELRRNVTVTDDAEDIAGQFRESWARSDVVLTTGGLGPTCDDRTREAIAGVLGQSLVFDPAIEKRILERFALFGRKMTPNNLKQAYRFERGEVLPNANGTAPGLWVEQDGKVLCMMPGPPNELQPMFTEQVLPRLAKLGPRARPRGLRPAPDGRDRRVAARDKAPARLRPPRPEARRGLLRPLRPCRLPAELARRRARPRRDRGDRRRVRPAARRGFCQLWATTRWPRSAPTCCAPRRRGSPWRRRPRAACWRTPSPTSAAPRSSFAGGCVCYSNDSKMQLLDVPECLLLQHGAVSAEAAVAMATGAAEKLGADYALAITGFSRAPAAARTRTRSARSTSPSTPRTASGRRSSAIPGPRTTIKRRAVNAALDWLRRELVRAQSGATAAPKRRA